MIVALDIQNSILLKSKDKSFHALYYILHQMDRERNTWYADNINKEEICSYMSTSLPSLEKMLSSLKERNIIQNTQRGIYKLTDEFLEGC